MWKFLVRRLFLSVIILFIVALIIYTILRCLPTSYIEAIARERSALPGSKSYSEVLAQLKEVYKMNGSILEGFFAWIGDSLLKGNFGDSWVYNVPVIDKFKEVIWDSFYLGFASLILELVIAIPLGILAARKQYSKTDYAVTVFALVGISLPSFFFATLLKLVFAFKLNWVEPVGKVSRLHDQMTAFGQAMDVSAHFLLPVLTLTIVSIGFLMRYTRTNMLEVLNSDYIRTARAKGLSENKVINKHAFRNTLIPIVTIVGGTLPGLFAGAMITEQLFSIPGIGYTSYNAMIKGDLPFSMFYMLFLAALTLLGTLIADILYAVVDPRVRVN
ncbi:MAG TPA: ABC transporter permease [Oscillospiraceae bacterium]|nr:ABC transporter permease [Oscillospiraceae bacterium]HPF55869.1 ABC transporter permease [Clostridiales bacterium]HPK36441.1 ABC transporter permease [Oscillospiraceae bacterium]HPR76374.1 ABC transporter permease [Oscillospiraceae bacterium]